MSELNPFGEVKPLANQNQWNSIAQAEQQRAIAEVQAAIMLARANPRDQVAAMDRILNECSRQRLAETAVYQYSRGGTDISGPSIRLAETIARQWGNVQYGVREIEQRHGESVVQAYAWDVETNTRRETTFSVPHVRDTRRGRVNLGDARDIYETVANMGARRLRACILGIIPGDVIEAAVSQCELTMKAKADTSSESMQKMVSAFVEFGVTREQIEKRIQRRIDAIQPAQVVGLKKIYTSLRDGMSTAADWFEPIGSDGAPNPFKAMREAAPVDTNTGEILMESTEPIQDKPAGADRYQAERKQLAEINNQAALTKFINSLVGIPGIKAALHAEIEAARQRIMEKKE